MEKQKKNKRGSVALFGTLKVMVAVSLLCAMSVILGKYLAINVGEVLRFSFENMTIILAGIMFGPVIGLVAGVAADLIGCLLVGYAVNPIITAGAAAIGFLSGLLYMLLSKTTLPYAVKILMPVFVSHLVGSVLIKSIGLSAFYDMPLAILMLWRGLNYLIIGAAEYTLIYFIVKNKAINSQFERLKRG